MCAFSYRVSPISLAPEVALGFLCRKYHASDSELLVILSPRAVLRIQRELEACDPDKVRMMRTEKRTFGTDS